MEVLVIVVSIGIAIAIAAVVGIVCIIIGVLIGIAYRKKIAEAAIGSAEEKAKSIVTAPVSKESFKFAGLKYSGHTEFLGALTKTKNFCMMMICDDINSVMVTRHLPISKISSVLTKKDIVLTTKLSADFVKKIIVKSDC